MNGEDLKTWREARDMTQREAANLLGVTVKTIQRYESGDTPIKAKVLHLIAEMEKGADLQPLTVDRIVAVAEAKTAAPAPAKPAAKLTDAQIMAMSKEERYELAPNVRGWRYRSGSFLPKGIYREHVIPPTVEDNGATVTQIQWSSNGVGLPSMILIGSTKNMKHAKPDVPGFYRLGPGVYNPATDLSRDFHPNHPDGGKQAKRAGKDTDKAA